VARLVAIQQRETVDSGLSATHAEDGHQIQKCYERAFSFPKLNGLPVPQRLEFGADPS
jgi:hypothetical protein